MASRFGRNKRREMRLENFRLSSLLITEYRAHQITKHQLKSLQSDLDRWAEDIAYQLGRESAFNYEPIRYAVDDVKVLGGRMSIPVYQPVSVAVSDSMTAKLTTYEVIQTVLRMIHVEPEPMRRHVRVIIEGRDGGCAIAVNQNRWSPRDIETMSKLIASEIAKVYGDDT